MPLTKYAELQVLEVERETSMSRTAMAAGLQRAPEYEVISTEAGKTAHRAHFDYERRPGYIYVRSRAISSRTNDNYDEFPAPEIKKAYRTFVGKPVFVNHHNDDHRRARGVIIDAALHEDTNPDGTPDTWAEVLMEIHAVRFPRLAEEIVKGNIARTSMGTNVEYSICTACGNKAYSPVEYCQHIPRMKGMKIRRWTASGSQEETLIAERCYGLGFFENSLLVEDPADPTAYVLGVDGIQVAAHKHIDKAWDEAMEEMGEEWSKDQTKVSGIGDVVDRAVDKIYDSLPSTKRRVEEERQRNERFFDVLEQSLKDQMDEDDEEFGIGKYRQGVAIPRSMVEFNPADPIAVAMQYQAGTDKWPVTEPSSTYGLHYDAQVAAMPVLAQIHDLDWSGVPVTHVPFDKIVATEPLVSKEAIEHYANIPSDKKTRLLALGDGRYAVVDGHHHLAKDFNQGHTMVEARVMSQADLQRAAFRYDTGHVPYQHEYPGTKPHGDSSEKIPAGSTYHELHNENTPGYGGGSAQHEQDVQDKADADVERQHRQLFKQHHPGESFKGHLTKTADEDQCPYCEEDSARPLGDGRYQCTQCGKTFGGENWRHPFRNAIGVNETKAPAQVDTMRAERCPVCQDDDAYDGERCGICGYVAPPEMFRDPDLDKAKQVDLRQDQLAQPDAEGNMAVPTDDVTSERILKCDHCGEEFGPDAEAAGPDIDQAADPTGAAAPAAPDQDQKPDEDQEAQVAPGPDPTNPHGTEAPDDLSDLADKTDQELGLQDDPKQPDAEADPQQAQQTVDPATEQPDDVADEGSLTDQQTAPDGSPLDTTDTVDKGDICPICGQGTIVSVPAESPDPTDPQKDPKDESREKQMPEQDPTKKPPVNPAKATRNRLVLALMGQQRQIIAQQQEIAGLRETVLVIGTAAGLGQHPRFVALRKQADDTNQTPEAAPATTSDGARPPDAKDDPTNVGAAPEGANVNVTPQAVTDVSNTDKVEPGNPPLSNLVDVTAPPPSGAASAPPAGDGDKVINPVTIGTPSTNVMDPAGSTGWNKGSSLAEDPQERYTASLRYARLRIAAGLDRGEDLALAEQISASGTTLETIKAQASLLSESLSAQQAQAPTRQQAQRLVPRSAQGSRAPSLGGAQADDLSVTAADGGLDEWAIGLDSLGE